MNLKSRSTALVLTGLLAAALTGCGSSDDADLVAADPAPSSSSSEPPATTDTPAEPSDTSTTDGGRPGTVAAPVYFVGDTPMGPRLSREFRAVESDNPMEEALALLVAGDTLDPDYGTLLPAMTVSSVVDDGTTITIDLGADSTTADKSISESDGALAVQSLVYTLQGITQSREPVVVPVGGTPTPFLGQPTDTGVEAAPQLDVLALVSVTTPETDATVSGTFTASGVASSFEANVPWEVRDGSDTVVLSGFATADGFGDELTPWETDVDVSSLDPGSYTFAALTDDPSGGEGPGAFEDTKTITVE
ncbi:hypothetical protein BH11ACT8_BH11ACT8_06400 [soil metagenome]